MVGITGKKEIDTKGKNKLFSLIAVLLILIVAIVLFFTLILPKIKDQKVKGAKDTSEYVGVFLTNTQVYFGKIKEENANYIVLTDVFFVAKKPKVAGQATESAYSINPLVNDPIGPADEIKLNRVNISTVQPLRNDSLVVKRINLFKAQSSKENTP